MPKPGSDIKKIAAIEDLNHALRNIFLEIEGLLKRATKVTKEFKEKL